jgi:hypothetical protein
MRVMSLFARSHSLASSATSAAFARPSSGGSVTAALTTAVPPAPSPIPVTPVRRALGVSLTATMTPEPVAVKGAGKATPGRSRSG